ncbi:dynamin family protein [Streptomyces sp. NPDC019890]|uniref:dynamin family protein n=1 Tax=Streptomyces sp. NPDC019890 TaxID=3365064 RepID=UPI00384CDB92
MSDVQVPTRRGTLMGWPAGQSLALQLEHSARTKGVVRELIGELGFLAEEFGVSDLTARSRAIVAALENDEFRVMVLGSFKTGKSTLVNALLAETAPPMRMPSSVGPLAVSSVPTTPVLTSVRYATTPLVAAHGHDGSVTATWPLDTFTSGAREADDEATQQRFGGIKEFALVYPARLCRAGLTIYDSPGLDDLPMRTAITHEQVRRCDAALLVFRGDMLYFSRSDLENVAALAAKHVPLFFVLNVFDHQTDAHFPEFARDLLREALRETPGASRNLADDRFHVVNAAEAWRVRRDANAVRAEARAAMTDEPDADSRESDAGPEPTVMADGLTALEQSLGHFLLSEREHLHLGAFLDEAEELVRGIGGNISEHHRTALSDAAERQARRSAVRSELSTMHERSRYAEDRLAASHREAERLMTDSFAQAVARIRLELPHHMEKVRLPSERALGLAFQQNRLLHEAGAEISEFVSRRITEWGAHTAPALLQPLLEDLGAEIEGEIRHRGQRLQEIGIGNDWLEGALTPRPFLTGTRAGAFAAGAGAAASIARSLVLGSLGAASAVLFWPAVLVAGTAIGLVGATAASRAKAKVFLYADKQLELLPGEMEPVIRRQLTEIFGELRAALDAALNAPLTRLREDLVQLDELDAADLAQRDLLLARLDDAARRLDGSRGRLRDLDGRMRRMSPTSAPDEDGSLG